MKSNIRSKRNSKPKILATVIILAILVIAAISTSIILNLLQDKTAKQQPVYSNPSNVVKINNNPPTTDQKAAGELQKKAASDTPPNNDLGISITNINTSNDPISIKSVISGAISNSGTCTLTLTKGNVAVTKQAGTYALPNSSTCKGFDINKSELLVGEWQLKLSVNVGTKTSSINDNFSLE